MVCLRQRAAGPMCRGLGSRCCDARHKRKPRAAPSSSLCSRSCFEVMQTLACLVHVLESVSFACKRKATIYKTHVKMIYTYNSSCDSLKVP